MKRWAEHFSKSNDVLVISDTDGRIPGVKVEQIFEQKAFARNLLKIADMKRIVREFGPDIVHGHYLTVGGFYAAMSKGKKIVGSAWGSDVYRGPKRSRIERMILRFVLKRCDLVFAGTKEMAQKVRSYGYKGDMAIFRFGVDPSLFRRVSRHGTGEFRILSIRPCGRIYNPMVILDAFRTVLPEMGDAYLYVFDFGDLAGFVHETVEDDPRLKDRVRFVPRKNHDEMLEVYNSADIAVSLPDSDSAAASVLESMACELPVIATNIPNMAEWIEHGVNGYLTLINTKALSDRLRMAYSDRQKLPETGKRAREKVVDERSQGTFESNIRVAENAYKKLTD